MTARAPAARVSRALARLFFSLAAAPVLFSFLLTTDGALTTLHLPGVSVPLRTVCALRLLTGWRCPACGMTRAFACLSHGQLARAWEMNPAGVLFYGFCVFEAALRAGQLLRRAPRLPRALRMAEAGALFACGAAALGVFAAQFV